MAVITIVTSAPPLTEGGHLVIARSLERALLEAGHRAGIVTTPSNRFGRQGPAYLANWLTDVGMTGDRRARRSGHLAAVSRVMPSGTPAHVCWLVHTMREYLRFVGPVLLGHLAAGPREGARAAHAHPRAPTPTSSSTT